MHVRMGWVVLGVVAGCGSRADVPCGQSADCDLHGGGQCVVAATGTAWCAYPDPACPGGLRFSDQAVGDGLAGSCVGGLADAGVDAAPDAPDALPGGGTFAVTYGGTASENVVGLAAVADGVLVVGTLASDAQLGGTAFLYGGGADFVRAKLDAAGQVVWAAAQNDPDQEQIAGVGADPAGSMTIAGTFAGSVSFGGEALVSQAGNYDLFVAKYAGGTGAHVWSQRYGGPGEDHALATCVDPSGDLYVAGYFSGTTNLGGGDLASAGGSDGFVAKYRGGDGGFAWGVRFGGASDESAEALACDATRVVVGGRFRSPTINLGGADLASAGADDLFVASFTSSGAHGWSARHGGSSNDDLTSLALGGGAVYVAGSFAAPLGLGGITLTPQGAADLYVARYDAATGAHAWSRGFGGAGSEVPAKIIVTAAGIAIAGRFSSTLDLGGGALSSAGGDDVFVATLSPASGAYVDAWRTGGTQNDFAAALASTPAGLVVGGGFAGINYFGAQPRTSQGLVDAFVFRP